MVRHYTFTDPRSVYYIDHWDPTTLDYGNYYREQHNEMKDYVQRLRAEQEAEAAAALRAPQQAALALRQRPLPLPFDFDDVDEYVGGLLFLGSMAGGRQLSGQQWRQLQAVRQLRERQLDAQQENYLEGLRRQLPERLTYRPIPLRFARPDIRRELVDSTMPLAFNNRPETMQIPHEELQNYLNYPIWQYQQLVGDDQTLHKRFESQVNYPINRLGQDYVAQELSSHRVEMTMNQRGLPSMDYLVQVQGHSTTFLGRNPRPVTIDRYTPRGLAQGELDNALTTHRFWICMDYVQCTSFMTTGYLFPNLRAYNLMEATILNYVMEHYPQGEYAAFRTRMADAFTNTHFNVNYQDPSLPPDNEFTTGHFWNLNFHERHQDALHFWCKLFIRGGKQEHRPKEHYRVLGQDGVAQCFCVGLRFHKCHLEELLAQDKVTLFNRHYSQYSIATTTLDYHQEGDPIALAGDERHGRTLVFRTEEVLDSIAVHYAFDYPDYQAYYSVENLYIQDAVTTRHLLYDRIPRSTIACYLLSEDYFALRGTILAALNALGHKTREQLRQDYQLPFFRQLDNEVILHNYAEHMEALLQIFTEAGKRGLIESYGRWHYPPAEWNMTRTPAVNPDYLFGQGRARL